LAALAPRKNAQRLQQNHLPRPRHNEQGITAFKLMHKS
jgi:hypothetical protein